MKFYLKMSAFVLTAVAYGLGLWLCPYTLFTFVLGIPVCCWLVSLLHELGHFLAYRLLKLEWKQMIISNIVFERDNGIRIDEQQKFFTAGCTCTYQPEKPFWHYVVALLSGGLLCAGFSIGAILSSYFTFGGAKAFLLCFGIMGALNALVNLLLPFSADRRLIKQIKKERENTL